MNLTNKKPRLGKKTLCVFLSFLIAFGGFTSIVFGNSQFQDWLGIRGMLSAYASEIVDTKGAVSINEEAMLDNSSIIDLKLKDGSNTAYVFSEPVTFVDENGNLKAKDISIKTQSDDSLSDKGFDYTNGQNDYRINFSKDSTKGVLINFEDYEYSISPIECNNNSGEKERITSKELVLDAFKYENLYGNNTALIFYPQLNGLKEEIVISEKNNVNCFYFQLTTNNCQAVLNEDGTVSILDSDGNELQLFNAPYAYDSEYVSGINDEHYSNAEFNLTDNGEGIYTLSIIIDEEWLNSPSTVYPITIDPTTSQISNMYDLPIHSTRNTTGATIENNAVGTSTQYGTSRSMIKFQKPSEITHCATINSAYYWTRELTEATSDFSCSVYQITSSWNENSLWSTAPSYNSSAVTYRNINGASTDYQPSPHWYKFDITDLVQMWYTGTTNYGFMMKYEDEQSSSLNFRAFAQQEYSFSGWKPYTIINYTNDEIAPTIQSVTGNPTEWTNSNVTLSVNGAADNQGGIGLHSSPYSFSTTQGSYSWQASNQKTISENGTYYIYVRDAYDNISLVSTQNITKIDKLKPYRAVITPDTSNWTQEVTLSLLSYDRAETPDSGRSGTKYYSCSLTEGVYDWHEINTLNDYGYIPVQSNGTYYVYAKDVAGNISDYNSIQISNIDSTAPVINSVTDTYSNNGFTVTVTASDNESGLANEAYSFDGGQTWQSSNYATVTGDYSVKVRDSVGNVTNGLPPAPELYKENNLIHMFSQNSNADLEYKIGNGEWCDYTEPFAVDLNTEVTIYAKDANNNTSMKSENFSNTLGIYNESATDFTVNYFNSTFDFSRYYDSADESWFYSMDSTATKISDILYEVQFVNGNTIYFEKQGNTDVYKNSNADISLEETSTGCSLIVSKCTYHYDTNGKLDYVADKADHRINITRSSNSIEISYGNYSYVVSLSNGKPSSVTTPLGEVLTYDYSWDNLETVYYDGADMNIGRGNNWEIDISAYRYNEIITESLFKSITYDLYDRVIREELTSGEYTEYSYSGNTVTITQSLGSETQTTTIVYNNALLPIEETLPDGTVNTYTYNSDYNLVSVSQTVGEDTEVIKEYTYNSDGTLHTSRENGTTTYYSYNNAGLLSSVDKRDGITYYSYNSNNDVSSIYYYKKVNATTDFGSLVRYQYTYNNSMVVSCVCTDTPNDKKTTTTYVYDSYGNAVSTSSTTIDGDNNTTVTGSTSTYDALGRVLTTTTDNNQVSYVYDSVGKVIRQTESQTIDNVTTDRVTRFIYDDFGRLLQQINPDYYSAEDDGLNEQTPVDTYDDSNIGLRYHYDYYTDVIDYDINEQEVRSDYTYVNGVLREEDFDIYHFEYNNHGNTTEIDINNSLYAAYTYNSKQQNTSIAYGNGQTVLYEYDSNNNLKYQKYQAVPNGTIEIQFEYGYNNSGDLIYKADFATEIAEVYDNTNNTVTLCHFTYQNNQVVLGTELAHYSVTEDSQNNTTSLVVEAEDNTYLSSAYGENSVVYNNGSSEFEYGITEDTLNSTKEISVYNNTLDSSIFDCTYSYNSEGQIESYTFSSVNEEFTYGYTYDEYGNITAYGKIENDEFVPIETQYYYYDSTNHKDLIENDYYSFGYDVQEEYTYDTRGNILSYNETGTASNFNDEYECSNTFAYANDWSDKLSTITYTESLTESVSYLQHDSVGNLTKIRFDDPNSDSYAIKYNWTNGRQLERVESCDEYGAPYDTYAYTYNDNGIRTSEKYNNQDTVYKMLMGDKVLAEFTLDQQMNISVTKEYLYDANQELVGHIANGKTYFYLKNAQGDIQAVINEEGLCVKIYVYSAWGKEITNQSPDLSSYTNNVSGARLGSDISNFYRGYELDDSSSTYYLQSRYYDCYWFYRFINADIPQIAQLNKNAIHGLNLYAYCADNPVMYSDPSGYDNERWTIAALITEIFVCLDLQEIAKTLKISFTFDGYDEYKRIKSELYTIWFNSYPNYWTASTDMAAKIAGWVSLAADYVPKWEVKAALTLLPYVVSVINDFSGRYLSPKGGLIMMLYDWSVNASSGLLSMNVSSGNKYFETIMNAVFGEIFDIMGTDIIKIYAYSWYLY